jgi:gamma-glutamylcyclotransferase (GGCT)/AIG2-like uncharacterized protein YtfP
VIGSPGAAGVLDYPRAALERALRTINEARAAGPGRPGRVEGLLRGLDALMGAGSDRTERDGGGGRAFAELDSLLANAGGAANTRRMEELLEPILDQLIDALLGRPAERLASYGSLRPGEVNHHHVSDLVGRWHEAEVRGRYYRDGGEATRGFPGVIWQADGDPVRLLVFESPALRHHWPRLDDFEGPGYRRVLVPAVVADGLLVTNLYAIVEPPDAPPTAS